MWEDSKPESEIENKSNNVTNLITCNGIHNFALDTPAINTFKLFQ